MGRRRTRLPDPETVPVPMPPPVTGAKAHPLAWGHARELCPDPRRLVPLVDGSVFIANWRVR